MTRRHHLYRFSCWSIICIALLALLKVYSSFTTSFDSAGNERMIIAASAGILGILSVCLFPDFKRPYCAFIAIIVVCVLARIAIFHAAPSDDINRNLWEGKLTSLGISPYQGLADDDAFIDYRDGYWEQMNHKDKPTAYPPLAMQAFSLINRIEYSPTIYKLVFACIDLITIVILLALLAHHHLPLRWSLFYGLSPLTLISFSAEAHFDIIMVAAFTLSLLAYSKKWFLTCGIAIGIAVGAKIMAIVVAPLILWRIGSKGIIAFCITLLVPLIFYWNDLIHVFNALFAFGSGGGFNGPMHHLFRHLLHSASQASLMICISYALCWFLAFYLMLKGKLWPALLCAFGGLLIFSPIVHFWYLTWVLPLVAIRPKASWVSLSVSFSFYFLVWETQAHSGYWGMPLWAQWLFWLPFAVLFLAELRHGIKRLRHGNLNRSAVSWSIVIPSYRPDKAQLSQCLDSLNAQTLKPREVIISHAGEPLDLAQPETTTRIIESALGRGEQIRKGTESATQSWVMVVHSDVVLPPQSLAKASQMIEANPGVVGGAIGQRFNHASIGLLVVEAMNDFRATLLRTSFGDQSQFFHRKSALKHGILTTQKLMEDVEMSDRLNTIGEVVLIDSAGIVSSEKWLKGSYWKRFFTVIEFMLRYRLSFTAPKRVKLCEDFYKRYYKNKIE